MKRKHETLTCGIFYCRDSAKINGCGSLQTSSWFDSELLRSRQQKHTAVRYKLFKKRTAIMINYTKNERN
jgi:hypothetical protein